MGGRTGQAHFGELLALRWADVELLDGRLIVRQAYVRGQFQTPKSRASRRTLELGPHAVDVLTEVYEESRYRAEDCLGFCHPALGTPLDPSKLAREYMRPALKRANITKPFRPWHDLRHTSLTHEAAAGNPQAYVQLKAGTRRAPSPSATSTPRRCSCPVPRAVARSACSAQFRQAIAVRLRLTPSMGGIGT